MGRLVQQAPPARTDRQLASRRGGSALLCPGRGTGLGRMTQAKPPPRNPVRVTPIMQLAMVRPAERYRELVADLPTEGSWLREPEMVRIARLSAANQAGLR